MTTLFTSFLQIPHSSPHLKQNESKQNLLKTRHPAGTSSSRSDMFIQLCGVQLILSQQKQMQVHCDFYFHEQELGQQSLRFSRMPVAVFWQPSCFANFLWAIYSNQFSFNKKRTASSKPFWYKDSIFSWSGGNKAWLSLTRLARDSCNRARSYKLVY